MEKQGQLDQLFVPPSQWYNYKCVSCNYETETKDIIVDVYFHLQDCKKGLYPTFISPKCNKRMKYTRD